MFYLMSINIFIHLPIYQFVFFWMHLTWVADITTLVVASLWDDPHILIFSPLCSAAYIVSGLVCVTGRIEYTRRNGVWFLRLDHKRHQVFLLAIFLGLFTLGETRYHVMSSPTERPAWWGTEASCQQPCEWAHNRILQYPSSFQVTTASSTILIASS